MKTSRMIAAIAAAWITFGASPAMAQSEGGADDPPQDIQFATPDEVDAGVGCSRKRPWDCTPEERDSYNEIVAFFCAMGGGTAGTLDAFIVTWAFAATGVGVLVAPYAGPSHGAVVAGTVYLVCYSRYKIPSS